MAGTRRRLRSSGGILSQQPPENKSDSDSSSKARFHCPTLTLKRLREEDGHAFGCSSSKLNQVGTLFIYLFIYSFIYLCIYLYEALKKSLKRAPLSERVRGLAQKLPKGKGWAGLDPREFRFRVQGLGFRVQGYQ